MFWNACHLCRVFVAWVTCCCVVSQVATKVEEGVKELKRAEKSQKQSRMILCIMFLLCAVILLVIIVVLKNLIPVFAG